MDKEKYFLHLRYKPKEHNFKNCSECPAFKFFDWVIWTPDDRCFKILKTPFPKKILCLSHPSSLKLLIKLRWFLKDVTLVVAGEDTLLSTVTCQIDVLSPYCKKIYFEAKDIEYKNVHSFSMGFNLFYLKRFSAKVLDEYCFKVKDPGWKKDGVLVAWGSIWKHLDEQLSDRRQASQLVEKSEWLNREELGPDEYLQRLAASKFLIAPAGQGVQAPKLAEAWLMRTVPIVVRNPCFEDLERLGFPFVLLDAWDQLSPKLLLDYEDVLNFINWKQVERMLTLKYFKEEILENPLR